MNPNTDSFIDIVFGNYEGDIYALLTNRTDTDGDGIIDLYDNDPTHPNAPRIRHELRRESELPGPTG